MTGMTREQQRAEIHRTIWGIAETVRNGIDAWDFKQYVLGMLFYRYISEDFAHYIDSDEIEAGDDGFSYAALKDEDFELDDEEHDDLIKEKGCFIYPSQLFCNVWAFAKKAEKDGTLAESNLNTILHNTLDAIEHSSVGFAAEEDFQGLFDDFDTSSKRLGGTVGERNKRLLKLMDGIGNMDLGHFDGQPRRRVRRRLRVPDAHVCEQRWQVRRRVLHPSRGEPPAHAHRPRRAIPREQGLRPDVRLRRHPAAGG